ncbi:MAG: oxidoreductase, partial [Mycobacterium sp.]|nr:oxidoreductase [Mycobacterium sp.]
MSETQDLDQTFDDRLARLYATDPEFAAAKPSASVNAAVNAPGLTLPDIVRTVLTGYADRPALGARAVEFVTDETGRTVAELQPRFETITHGQLWERVRTLADAWRGDPVNPGDRVALLGFTSIDYTVADIALTQLGAVSVPLQTSASAAALAPIIAETEPVLIASSIDYLEDAVELALGSTATRLAVFDYRPQVDDQRDALVVASARLGDRITLETLDEALARPASTVEPVAAQEESDPLSLLIYTSGSTGAPKGAMYPASKVADIWRPAANAHWDDSQGVVPSVVLSFMPMSHVMGRGIL